MLRLRRPTARAPGRPRAAPHGRRRRGGAARARVRRRRPLLGRARPGTRLGRPRGRRAPRRPRPAPPLLRADGALRRAGARRDRHRLLRPHRRHRAAAARTSSTGPHVQQATAEQVQADIAAAVAALRERTGAERVVAVGFCYGGALAFLASTTSRSASTAWSASTGRSTGPRGSGCRRRPSIAAEMRGADPGALRRRGPRASGREVVQRSTPRSSRPASSTRSSCTPAPRIPSSTAPSPSTPRRARTPGGGCWASCAGCPRPRDRGAMATSGPQRLAR